MADLFFGPPVVQRAETGESLSMAALRVAVGAPRDGELRALAVELAATRRAHAESTEALNTENRRLRRRLSDIGVQLRFATTGREIERQTAQEWRLIVRRNLALGADVLARWVAEREGRMPCEVWDAILLMRREGLNEDFDPEDA
jgi:hypothetical protein